jgi:hypothetical protein
MLPLGLEAMLVAITATMISYVLLNLRYRHLVRAANKYRISTTTAGTL